MKSFLKKLIVLIAIVLSASFVTSNTFSAPAHATKGNCDGILGLTPWYCNVEDQPQKTDDIKSNIVIIAANVLTDISVVAAYLVLGYVIYGGYLYMFSSGDPSKVAAGKKTLAHAFTGFGITVLAYVIINTIRIAFFGANGGFENQISDANGVRTMVTNMIQWIVAIAGVVAVIFVVIGGISYTTSAGDPTKLQKAKQTILYALIGLAVVGLAEIIVAVVSSILDESKTAYVEPYTTTQIVMTIDNDNQKGIS